MQKMITVTREHYEKLKSQRLVLFAANNGEWSDEELEQHAVEAAMSAAGELIESQQLTETPLSQYSPGQFQQLLQQAAWAYMQVYVDYVPF